MADDLSLACHDLRWLLLSQFNRHDPKAPDVDGSIIPCTARAHKFGRHPSNRSHDRLTALLDRQLAREAKIGQFDVTATIHEHVVTLDVSMDNFPRVQIAEAFQGLPKDELDAVFSVLVMVLFDYRGQVAVHHLQKDPDPSFVVVAGENLKDRVLFLALVH